MQYYLDGYVFGDPELAPAAPGAPHTGDAPPDEVDVLIVGTGPAGLVLAAQLSVFPDIRTAIVERRDGPLELGHADGVACRSVEMFDTFGLSERLLKESYWVNETVFWEADDADPDRIVRIGRIQDVEDDLSEMPHVIVNQARIHQYLLDFMAKSPTRLQPHYGLHASHVELDPAVDGGARAGQGPASTTVTLERADGTTARVRARYVVGCDGARSVVRESIGRALHGDVLNHAWGVMDVLAVTDFPDIRLKSVIQSTHGNLLIIPREGGHLVRFYVDLGDLEPGSHLTREELSAEALIATTNRILHPFTLDVRDVAWWSLYEVGQRVTDKFDDVDDVTRLPKVFIAGDACHTHSAKAGQGMNVSMADAFNLGWKLVAVLRGRAVPELLHTYSGERQVIAQELIDFDREFAARMSSPDHDQKEFQEYFTKQLHFTAGVATRYTPSMLTAADARQELATGLTVGMRFHSAPVIRLIDAKRVELGHVARADGAWRIYAFAGRGDPTDPDSPMTALCDHLTSASSVIARFTPAGADPDSVIDLLAIFQQGHREVDVSRIHPALMPAKGRLGLRDQEKVFCPDLKSGRDIFDVRGIDRDEGALVVVRPDQYVAHILPLDAVDELDVFFAEFLIPAES